MHSRVGIVLAVLTLLAATVAVAAPVVVNCPFSGAIGDGPGRGFYVTNYPAATLNTVTLNMTPGSPPGPASDTLTARLGTYSGPTLGTATASFVVGTSAQPIVYDFGGVPVTPGSTITFAHSIADTGMTFWDTGTGPCPNVVETEGTTPPLDTFRRNSYGLQITGAAAVTPVGGPTLPPAALFVLIATLAGLALFLLRRQ